MTALSIMTKDILTLPPETTVAEALHAMCVNRVHNIPVVDKHGCFLGLFSLRRITRALLPMAAQMNDGSFGVDMNFVSDNADEFSTRLAKIGHRPISEMLEKKRKLRFCGPQTSLPKIFQLLSENPTSLPVLVVKGKQKTVVGMISTWDVLTKIAATLDPEISEDGLCGESVNAGDSSNA